MSTGLSSSRWLVPPLEGRHGLGYPKGTMLVAWFLGPCCRMVPRGLQVVFVL
jgi:hypothetical protein